MRKEVGTASQLVALLLRQISASNREKPLMSARDGGGGGGAVVALARPGGAGQIPGPLTRPGITLLPRLALSHA